MLLKQARDIVRRDTTSVVLGHWVYAGGLPVIALVAMLACLPSVAGGQTPSFEQITAYDVEITVESSGSLLITESLAYFFADERHGILRDVPVRLRYDDTSDRVYPLEVLSVETTGGAPDDYEVEDVSGGIKRIRIGDPDRTIKGGYGYVIRYRVRGALNAFDEHDELYWNAVGHAWEVPIARPSVTVRTPAAPLDVACFAGPMGSQRSCGSANIEGAGARFAQPSLAPYEGLTIVVAIAKGVVPEPLPILEERWSLQRAFSVTPLSVGLAGAVAAAVVYGLTRVYWATGRDRRWSGSAVDAVFGRKGALETTVGWGDDGPYPAEYVPPEGMRPGLMGTLFDETAHPLDVTASIVDLAARGYLRIDEVPKEGWFGKADWKLIQLKKGDDLLEYEHLLLDMGLFEDKAEVLLSELKNKFAPRMQKVQEALYSEVVKEGWFASSPQSMRNRWLAIGIAAVVAAVALQFVVTRYTHFALVPVPLVLGSLVLAGMHPAMSRRTAAGTAAARHVRGFRRFIDDAEDERSRFAEQAHLFYDYLPYAIVFGLTAKWARAFEGLANQPQAPGWYGSSHAFSLMAFSDSMDNFGVTAVGTITSTPGGSGGSGFGGGSSGGGGGGGGGGSW